MKRSLTIFKTLLLMLTLFGPLAAQRKETVTTIPFSRAIYRVGERLTYNVSFSSFISAAHVELYIAGRGAYFNRDGLQLRAHVETTGVVNAALYAINNDYATYIDPETGVPFRTQQVVREAGRTADTSREYNEPVGTAAIPARQRISEVPGTYDFLSALYRLRALPLTEGAVHRINVLSDLGQYETELKVTGRELIKTNVGSFNTIVTQLRVLKNSGANSYRMRIYFSDDERHVPVLMTAEHPSGQIRAELVGSELPRSTPQPTTVLPSTVTTIPRTQTSPTVPTKPKTPAQPSPSNSSDRTNASLPDGLPFKVGEQLNFNVFLGTVAQPVGTASFQVRARAKYFNRDGLLLAAKAETNALAQRVFSASDQINSYVDATTLLPFRTEAVLVEGRRRTNQTLSIDQDRGSAIILDKGTRIEIPIGTHDYISIFYALRSFNLTPPRRNAVSLMVHNRARTLFITSLRREIIELGGQRIPAVQLSLTTDDPQPDKYTLRLWVSEDQRRLPLRITASTELGPVRADLAIIPIVDQ